MLKESGELKDIIVQLTGSAEDDARLAYSAQIGVDFSAHITGVQLDIFPEILEITNPERSGTIREILEEWDKDADKSFGTNGKKFQTLKCSHDLRRLHGPIGDVGKQLMTMTRTSDLFIGTRPYGDPTGRTLIEEYVLFGSGRPCLFIPPGGSPRSHVRAVVIAWDGSKEAARATADALPFLKRAQHVHLVAVSSFFTDIDVATHFGAIVPHLAKHGIKATTTALPYETSDGEQIEKFAHQKDADLIVMGAYGHSRMREWVFGGATRQLLRHAMLPVFMSH